MFILVCPYLIYRLLSASHTLKHMTGNRPSRPGKPLSSLTLRCYNCNLHPYGSYIPIRSTICFLRSISSYSRWCLLCHISRDIYELDGLGHLVLLQVPRQSTIEAGYFLIFLYSVAGIVNPMALASSLTALQPQFSTQPGPYSASPSPSG